MAASLEQGRRMVADSSSESPPQTLAEIYEANFAFVWRSLRALGVSQGQLDDAVQDVFLVVHRRLPEFERRSELKTWLFGITLRVAANARRGAQRRETVPLPTELVCAKLGPQESAERAEAARFVHEFLARCDEGQRAAFIACELEGLTVPEAAQALGVNVNTLYSRVRAVRSRFMAKLSARGPKP
jgi:RNA polymerase sigma-70 factor (ECF subfamily)